jgi:hypothetical protein
MGTQESFKRMHTRGKAQKKMDICDNFEKVGKREVFGGRGLKRPRPKLRCSTIG